MIFNFTDGTTKAIQVGSCVKGLRNSALERPVSVTLTHSELLAISEHPEYLRDCYIVLDVRPRVLIDE